LRNIRHFIWDFDGTLFDTYPANVSAFWRALSDCGVSVEKNEIYTLMMNSITQAFKFYSKQFGLGENLINNYKVYIQEELQISLPFPYAKELCELVHKSGKHNYLYTHRGDSANQFLMKHKLQKYFTETVTKQNGFKRKPDPEGLMYLLAKYNMKKEETLMVGDRELDILCGKNAGILTCYISNGMENNPFNADYCYNSIGAMFDSH